MSIKCCSVCGSFGYCEHVCEHINAVKEEHLTGTGAMEYIEWYDNHCPDCGKHWTTNE